MKENKAEEEHHTKYTSVRASYAERNQTMKTDSDFCVFYFDETCPPTHRKKATEQLL